jgi:hypothetical protein
LTNDDKNNGVRNVSTCCQAERRLKGDVGVEEEEEEEEGGGRRRKEEEKKKEQVGRLGLQRIVEAGT